MLLEFVFQFTSIASHLATTCYSKEPTSIFLMVLAGAVIQGLLKPFLL